MSVLERLSNFSAVQYDESQLPYNNSSISGYFFNSLYREGFNLSELKPIIERDGNKLVVAIAGSGKTTYMNFQILFDIVTGKATMVRQLRDGNTVRVVAPILVSTFSKAGVKVIQQRFTEWVRVLKYSIPVESIKFKTLHGVYKSILHKMGVNIELFDGAEELRPLLKQCVKKLQIKRVDGGNFTNEDYKVIDSIITYYRNRLDSKKYNHPSCDDYGLIPILLDSLVEEYKQARRKTGKFDFDDMQEMLLQACRVNPDVRDLVASQFEYFYFDESQDTSQLQYELILYMTAKAKQVVAIGDDDQTIYTWRGSDVNIITKRFQKDFDASIEKLSINYRCPSNILNPISNSIVLNKARFDKTLTSSRDGGELNVLAYPSLKDLGTDIVNRVKDDIKLGNQVAILCRTNYDGAIPAFLLEASGVDNISIRGEMTLNSPLPKKLIGAVSLIIDRTGVDIKQTLEMLVDYKNRNLVASVVDTWKNTGVSFLTARQEDLRHTFPELIALRNTLRDYLFPSEGESVDEFLPNEFGAYDYLLNYMKFSTFKGESPYCENARAYIDCLLFFLNSRDFDDLYDFRDTIRAINGKLQSRVGRDNSSVIVTTAHDSKGLEYASVYIWNDSEGTFPSSKSMSVKLNDDLMEEERRVHYIAWTRAVKKCTVTTLQGREGMFLKETNIKPQLVGKLGGVLKSQSVIDKIDTDGEVLYKKLTE